MNIDSAKELASRYLAPTVVVILVLVGGFAWEVSLYKNIQAQKDQLNKEIKAISDEKVASEKNITAAAMALLERKAELDKREYILQQLEKETNNQSATLQQRAIEYGDAYSKLQQAQLIVGHEQRVKSAEEDIKRLMSEFSRLGVNLNDPLKCNDQAWMAKYNAAKAKYSEIYTTAEAFGLKNRFNTFLFQNGQNHFSSCP